MIKYVKSPDDQRLNTDEKVKQFILDHLRTWNGTAPTFVIKTIPTGDNANAEFIGGNEIIIDKNLAMFYDSSSPPYIQPDGFRMFFIVLLCHEFLHWADAQDYLPYSNNPYFDVNDHFEFDILGGNNTLKSAKFKITSK